MGPDVIHCQDALKAACDAARSDGATVGFVPTMGALHDGHLALVKRAAADCEAVAVSIYVNALQFDDPGDLRGYPRTLEEDTEKLAAMGVDWVFAPDEGGAFAKRCDRERLEAGPEASGLEGEHRPGHFDGVATVVAHLFDVAGPCRAYFGAKDWQQTRVVAHLIMAEELRVDLVVCPTVREPDGLALSSRNERLGPDDRAAACSLSQALFAAREDWHWGQRDAALLEAAMAAHMSEAGADVEYAAVRDPKRLGPVTHPRQARALVAARVGGVRLIDNLSLPEEARA